MFFNCLDELKVLEESGRSDVFRAFLGKNNAKVCGDPVACKAIADWLEEEGFPKLANNWRVRAELEQKLLDC